MILGLGDCNMAGSEQYRGKTYMELLNENLNKEVKTYAITMSTTKEGRILFDKYFDPEVDIVIVAFGLVDSWKTFKYAPYVLYYPDNIFRKIARKVVKKYKKLSRKWGLNRVFGEKFVVNPDEFKANLLYMAKKSPKILFIETPPHRTETFRNPHIQQYNALMQEVANEIENADVVKIYDDMQEKYYLDEIHFNDQGYEFVTKKILELI